MEIKKVNLVSRKDLESIVRNLELNIIALENWEVYRAICSLTRLKENIEANLKEEI